MYILATAVFAWNYHYFWSKVLPSNSNHCSCSTHFSAAMTETSNLTSSSQWRIENPCWPHLSTHPALFKGVIDYITNTAFQPKLAGLHRFLKRPSTCLKSLSHFPQANQPCDFYLKHYDVVPHWHHVSHHKCAGNSFHGRENNNRPTVKEVSVMKDD